MTNCHQLAIKWMRKQERDWLAATNCVGICESEMANKKTQKKTIFIVTGANESLTI